MAKVGSTLRQELLQNFYDESMMNTIAKSIVDNLNCKATIKYIDPASKQIAITVKSKDKTSFAMYDVISNSIIKAIYPIRSDLSMVAQLDYSKAMTNACNFNTMYNATITPINGTSSILTVYL
jgi:hypothetical protein